MTASKSERSPSVESARLTLMARAAAGDSPRIHAADLSDVALAGLVARRWSQTTSRVRDALTGCSDAERLVMGLAAFTDCRTRRIADISGTGDEAALALLYCGMCKLSGALVDRSLSGHDRRARPKRLKTSLPELERRFS